MSPLALQYPEAVGDLSIQDHASNSEAADELLHQGWQRRSHTRSRPALVRIGSCIAAGLSSTSEGHTPGESTVSTGPNRQKAPATYSRAIWPNSLRRLR